MGFWKWADAKAKKMSALDVGLVKISVFFLALLLAKLWPPLLSLDWSWYALVFVLAALKPTYEVFKSKQTFPKLD
ncbi:MAG: hypothetical protein WCY41_00290 [Candidatus Micrarchaeia archaeon]